MERIALDEGSYYRCLVQDGISPCSEELMQALERDSQKREHFTSEDRARIRNIREERYRRHRRFWTEFPEALLFERIGSNEIHFEPRRNYQATDAPPTTVLANMTGRFWFDPLTYEITKMEYELLGDAANPVVPLSKGTSFSIELARLATDGPLLPARLSVRRKLSQGRKREDSSTDLFNFRRFAVESDVRFTETDEVPKPSTR
jgi:hypothetical protein